MKWAATVFGEIKATDEVGVLDMLIEDSLEGRFS